MPEPTKEWTSDELKRLFQRYEKREITLREFADTVETIVNLLLVQSIRNKVNED